MTCLSHFPCSGIGLCIRRRNSPLTSLSFAVMRSRRVVRWIKKRSSACRAADQSKAQEVEGLRFAKPALLSLGRRTAAKLNQSGLVRVQRQRELLQPLTHCVPEAAGVTLMLKAYDQVVGISHYDHVARGLAPSPALGPKIEGVV